MTLKAIAFNGTLKSSGGDPSSTNRLLALIAHGLKKHGIDTDVIRLADHNILPESQPVSRRTEGLIGCLEASPGWSG
jgi:multimeric flavodoxin WrbA